MANLVPIVEGQSEVASVPILLRKISESIQTYNIKIAKPFRVKRNRVVKEGEIERAVKQAIRSRDNIGAIIVILDADDDCAKDLADQLKRRCATVTDLPVSIVIAVKEYECWLLGAKESLRGIAGIKDDACCPSNPESIRGAKGKLSQNMRSQSYVEVIHQPSFTAQMDIELARQNCPSFEKLFREASSLLSQVSGI